MSICPPVRALTNKCDIFDFIRKNRMHRQNDVPMKSQLSRNFGALYIYCRMHPAVVISYHVVPSITSYKKCDLFLVTTVQIYNYNSFLICINLQKYTENPAYSMRICRKITPKLTLFVWASEKFCKKMETRRSPEFILRQRSCLVCPASKV